MTRARTVAAATALALGCGSRTGLRAPDTAPAAPDAAVQAPSSSCAPVAEAGAPWPMFMRCASHEGRTDVVGAGRLSLRWTFGAHEGVLARVWGSPVVGRDGTVFVVTNGFVRALGPDGTSRWAYQDASCTSAAETAGPTPAYAHGFVAPALGEDGTVYVACTSKLVALDPATGGARWTLPFAGRVSSPTIAAGGAVLIATTDPESVVAVSSSGATSWTLALHAAGAETPLAPAVGADGTIYAAFAATSTVHAISADGTQRWSAQAGAGGVWAPLAVASDRLYVSPLPGACLDALDLDGGAPSGFACVGGLVGPPAIGADGTVLSTGSNAPQNDQELLFALSPTGATEWAVPDGARGVTGFPVIGGDGTVYAPGGAGGLYAFAPDGGRVWERDETTFIAGSPAIGADGTVYAMDAEGVIYAFGP